MTPYHPPAFFRSGHVGTVYPTLFRKVVLPPYVRERISTPDEDFLDLDWLTNGSSALVIISHGLEGNTSRAYVRGMARIFYSHGIDALAWNYRGCSEEMNRALRFYHSGATDDLEVVVNHAIGKGYRSIYLVGFSLGGNMTLKYLGEKGNSLSPQVQKAIAFSTPFDLHSGCIQLSTPSNWIYTARFLRSLKGKVIQKSKQLPTLDIRGIDKIKTLQEFDDAFTAPIHGFRNAVDYYQQCSSIHFVNRVPIPALVINAMNDPFLSEECYPSAEKIGNPNVCFEYPRHGGHVGFTLFNQNGIYWSELTALDFVKSAH